MYSDKPIAQTNYVAGIDPLTMCPYFETESIVCAGRLSDVQLGKWQLFGGVWSRLFGLKSLCLDKNCLLKYNERMQISPGMHFIDNAIFSRQRGALIHFKFFMDFAERVRLEASREEHWLKGFEYKAYAKRIEVEPDLCAFAACSEYFSHTTELIKRDVLRSS
jgi:hypothetical protein